MKSISCLVLSFIFLSFNPPGKEAIFKLKKFEKRMAQVKPGLFACKYEATNFEYSEFLKDVLKTGDKSLYEKARIRNENFLVLGSSYGSLAEAYHIDPRYAEYPVINVSHEGAQLFCDWLTQQYNAYPKREFKKVKFRLPAEKEWIEAAKGGNEAAIYPWGNFYLRGSDGIYLANFTRIPEATLMRITDGKLEIGDLPAPKQSGKLPDIAHLTAPVDSFSPYGFGIYHMSGNVAEMLAEPSRTKGGSWRSFGYYLRIDVEDEYAGTTEPSPMIGFRYFMEVVEE